MRAVGGIGVLVGDPGRGFVRRRYGLMLVVIWRGKECLGKRIGACSG